MKSMTVLRLRICVWCLRNLIFFLVINACISHGLCREFNEAVVKKLFIPERNNLPKVNVVQSSASFHSSRNKINNISNKYLKSESRRQRISSNLRLKRNTLLADEDLFEFMVRIANTPAEWERIRRVLSRIKQEEVASTLDSQAVSSVAPPPVAGLIEPNSLSVSQVKKWPSSEWIKDMVENATKEDSYAADDDELDESDSEFTDETSQISFHSDAENKPENTNTTDGQIKAANRNIKLIPNSDLPNFVYRQVIPDSDNLENSAYIAVSVISRDSVNTTTKETEVEVDESVRRTSKKSAPPEQETRRRHLKKKIHET